MKMVCCMLAVEMICSCNLFFKPKEEGSAAISIDSSYAFDSLLRKDSVREDQTINADTAIINPGEIINTKKVHPDEVVSFAETLIGIPYHYGSADPEVGFDCSGFITYVFNHFHITVPRSSIDFTYAGKEVPVASSKPGDLILFTGTDSTEHFVGHMGIIVSHINDSVLFIHSTSGKSYSVTITPLNDYYKSRFVKTIRVFKQNDEGV
jgi:cell wall-associated NlpC family hydrolase